MTRENKSLSSSAPKNFSPTLSFPTRIHQRGSEITPKTSADIGAARSFPNFMENQITSGIAPNVVKGEENTPDKKKSPDSA
jgi:hypothetical protein